MKTNPLDQLKGICEQLLFRVANLHKSFKHFFIETMICYLSINVPLMRTNGTSLTRLRIVFNPR